MAIGNPINLTSNVEGKNISVIATAGQTQFTVTGGYRINQISVFRNGVRLVDGRDFTALDGSIVTLLSAATVADVIEFQVFDDFRVSDALNVNSGGTVNGNVTVTGILSTTNLSIGSSISLDATTGIITAVQVIGATLTGTATTAINAQGLTGTPDITVNNIVAAAGTFSGVLTYEDVTNIDSLGIVTARTGVDITANGLVVNAGVSTFAADVSIADKIVHTGDTNTAIRFPSADTFTVETAGVQRLEVDSTGDLGLVGIATATGLVVVAGSGVYAGHTGIITAVTFDGALSGAATQVTVADESSDTTCFPLFATGATGDLAPKSGTNLTFNSSSGALTATSFVGALTGNVTGNISGGTVAGSTGTFTGDVDIADKIVHTGDTNTAIRFPAADTFTVETGGSERLRIDSSGNTGIGTNNPGGTLHIDSSGGATVRLSRLSTNNSKYIQLEHDGSNGSLTSTDATIFSNGGGEKVRITSAGEVIVNGTATGSNAKFEVQSTTGSISSATLRVTGEKTTTGAINTGSTILLAGHDGGNSRDFGSIFAGKENGTGSNYAAYLAFGTRANGSTMAERLRITSNGTLLLGATAAVGEGGTPADLNSAEIGRGFINLSRDDTAAADHILFGKNGSIASSIGTDTTNTLVFKTGTTERLRITSAGVIEVKGGDQSFYNASTVDGAGNNIYFNTDGGSSNTTKAAVVGQNDGASTRAGRLLFNTSDSSGNVTERLRIDSSGQLIHTGLRAGGGDNKLAILSTLSHNTSEEKVAVYISENEGSSNQLTFGGGSSSYNAVTTLRFMTASAVDTTTGTERLRIDSRGSFLFSNGALVEKTKITSGKLSDNTNIDLVNGMVHYFTTTETGTSTPNIRINSSTSLSSVMAVGDAISVTIVTQAASAAYSANITIDGGAVTEEWSGGSAPSSGGSGGLDVHTFTIIRGNNTGTPNSDFAVLATYANYN